MTSWIVGLTVRLVLAVVVAVVVVGVVAGVATSLTSSTTVTATSPTLTPPTWQAEAPAAPVAAPVLGCWTDPKPVAEGGPERICGDRSLAPADATGFGPFTFAAPAAPPVTSVQPVTVRPVTRTSAVHVRVSRPTRVSHPAVHPRSVHRAVKTPKPVRVKPVKTRPVRVVLVPVAAVQVPGLP